MFSWLFYYHMSSSNVNKIILGVVKLLINDCEFLPEKQLVIFPQNTNVFALDMVLLQW